MKKLSTKKLFYGKWPYKIECNVSGAHLVRLNGIEWVKKFCADEDSVRLPKNNYRYDSYKKIDKTDLIKFVLAAEPYLINENVQIRNEGRIFNFYTDSIDIVNELEKKLSWCIDCVHYPDNPEEAEFLANNKNKVICDAIPYGKYTHKVIFKERIPRDKRLQFWSWITKYDEETVKIGRSTEQFMIGSKQYVPAPFCYVSNAKFLTMLSLVIGEYVQRIEEFVPRSTLLL
jgi:hypothetical protein